MSVSQLADARSRRVCLIGDVEPPPGGVATYCRHLTAGLAHLGWDVIVLDTNGRGKKLPPPGTDRYIATTPQRGFARAVLAGDVFRDLHDAESGLQRVCRGLSWKDRGKSLALGADFRRVIERHRAALVHTSHAGLRSLAALRAARRVGVPCVVTIFGAEFTSPRLRPYLPLALQVCTLADSVVAISHHTARAAADAGVGVPVRVVYPGIDVAAMGRAAATPEFLQRYRLDAARPLILYAGWLILRKGPQVLLRALARLPTELLGRIQVVLIGPDHGLAPALRETIRQHGWRSVEVVGEVPPEDVPRFYHAASVLVFPTITEDEGFGLVAVEAAAAGCAVLGSRVGAIPEVVSEGLNGALFQPDADAQLASLLVKTLSNRDLLERWRAASPGVAARFDYLQTAAQCARVYEDLIG